MGESTIHLFMAYLKKLSVAQTAWLRIMGLLTSNAWERICKEEVVAC